MTHQVPPGRVESDDSPIPLLLRPSASVCDFPQVTLMSVVGEAILDAATIAGANLLQNAAMEGVEYMLGSGGPTSGVVTTSQFDVANQYRYKKMPKYKKKRWVKGLKKQSAMDMAKSATQTVVLNNSIEGSMAWLQNTSRTQNWMAVHLYGMNGVEPGGVQEVGVRDLDYIKITDYRLKTQKNTRVKFESAVLDLTVKNPNTIGLEVDIYDVTYTSTSRQTSLTNVHSNLISSTLNNLDTAITSNAQWDARGVTPFDTVQFAATGARIVSKRKVFLKSQETFTYQYRDPKNHYISPDDFDDTTGFVKPYTTRTILFIYKGIIGEMLILPNENKVPNDNPRLLIGVTRTYKYKIKGEVQNGLIVG